MSKTHGGKGSTQRPTDMNKFNENYDRIFLTNKIKNLLIPALRQYRHNYGSEEFIAGYDKEETERIVYNILLDNNSKFIISNKCLVCGEDHGGLPCPLTLCT